MSQMTQSLMGRKPIRTGSICPNSIWAIIFSTRPSKNIDQNELTHRAVSIFSTKVYSYVLKRLYKINYFSYIYISLFHFKLFFILVLFYFIKNNYLITIHFSINNYFIFFIIENLIFLIIKKYYIITKKIKIKNGSNEPNGPALPNP